MDQLEKQAAQLLGQIKQAVRLEHQSYMPQNKRRNLTKEELAEIEAAKGNILPKFFPSLKDPVSSLMFSPKTTAALGALIGGAGGGLLGLAGGQHLGAAIDKPNLALYGAGGGAALGATLGGILGYKGGQSHNDSLEEQLTRLPRDARLRDYYADAFYQAGQQRAADASRTALLASALMNN